MEEKTFNEVIAQDTIIQGVAYKKGEVLRQVRIREEEAEINNQDTKVTKIEYKLAKEQPKGSGEKSIDEMTKSELIQFITDNELEIETNQNKPELIAAIKEAQKEE